MAESAVEPSLGESSDDVWQSDSVVSNSSVHTNSRVSVEHSVWGSPGTWSMDSGNSSASTSTDPQPEPAWGESLDAKVNNQQEDWSSDCSSSNSPTSSTSTSPSAQRKVKCRRHQEEVNGLWVFGYGSLCWHQGFKYDKSLTGFVKGFTRRFWQGNTTHRGTEEEPGRVATLVKDDEGMVWGRAFQVLGEDALPYLNNRECVLGGYLTTLTTFYPRNDTKPFPAIIYLATSSNTLWLGDAPLPDIAKQIVHCKGNSGYNAEYLLRLAEYMRDMAPEAEDEHLFGLETHVRGLIKEQKLCLKTLMGDVQPAVKQDGGVNEAAVAGAVQEPAVRTDSFQYTARTPSKKLRCLNI